MRLPEARLPIGRQRLIVLTALLAVIGAAVVLPQLREGARGQSFAQSSPYLPYSCKEPTNLGLAIGRRQTFPLYNTSRQRGTTDAHSAGRMFPCISGTRWKLTFGNLGDDTQRGSVQAVNITNTSSDRWYWAGSGSSTGLYHLSFNNFIINSNITNVALRTLPNTPATGDSPYQLKLTPAGGITIGGNGVMTDMLVTGDSKFKAKGCAVIFICLWVEVGISAYTSISWLLSSNDFPLAGVDLEFYYLTTHKSNPGNPYDPANAPAGSAVQLPNTTIEVTGP